MIPLTRATRPSQLDDATATALTQKFKLEGESSWNKPYIKIQLLASSNNKCAYCETKIVEESKYMEVEHFLCKVDFPDSVVEWENLLPSCKRCNAHKGDHNVFTDGMIINPFADQPSEHIYISNYRLRWRTDIARNSIEILNLNDSDRLVGVRFAIGEKISVSLEIIREQLEEYKIGPNSTRKRSRIVRSMEALLREAQPDAEFSAVSSTVLLADPNFEWIKGEMASLGLWTQLATYEQTARTLTLPPP